MNLDSLNKLLTLIANVGVLVGIFVVAIELQQTQTQMQAEASARRANMSRQQNLDAVQFNVGEIISKIRSGVELSDSEAFSARQFMNNVLRYHESLHHQYSMGVLDEESWISSLNVIRRMCNGENYLYNYLFPDGLTSDNYRASFQALINPPCPD